MLFTLLFSIGCFSSPEKACVDSCESKREFWEACYEEFQDNSAVDFYCYTDVDALGEALAAAVTVKC